MNAALPLAVMVGLFLPAAQEGAHQDDAAAAAAVAYEAAQHAATEHPALPTTIPDSYAECASRFQRASVSEGDPPLPRFDCTWRYFDSLGPVTTYDFAMAGNRSVAVGDLYIDEMLEPDIARRLVSRTDNDGWAETRRRLLSGFISAARAAGMARCAVVNDINDGGTIRIATGSFCAVENRDKLIDDLLRIREEFLPRG